MIGADAAAFGRTGVRERSADGFHGQFRSRSR